LTAISCEAETKREAPSNVGAQRAERATEVRLPAFDWTAVETALLAVRGI